MKNRILLILLMCGCLTTQAQTIHWIIFGATQDPDNGFEVRNSINALTTQFIDRINDAIAAKGYLPRQKVFTGSDFTEAKCKQVIRSLSCKKEDIIVFYYLGHGGRAQVGNEESTAYNKKYPWPDLAFDKANSNQTINGLTLYAVHQQLKQKDARLTVTIGMCCNAQNSQYKKHGMQSQSRKYRLVSKKFAKRVGQRLFLKHKGDVLVASAQPNQFSYGGSSYNGQDVDCFSAALCETIDNYADNDKGDNATWEGFLNEVSTKCSALAKPQGIQRPKRLVNVVLDK